MLFRKQDAFAVAGVVGCIVVGLLGVQFRVYLREREHGRAECFGNLRHWGRLLDLHRAEQGGRWPDSLGGIGDVHPQLLRCPWRAQQEQWGFLPARARGDYVYAPPALRQLRGSAQTTAVVWDRQGNHRDGTRNVLFTDGHVEAPLDEEFQDAVPARFRPADANQRD